MIYLVPLLIMIYGIIRFEIHNVPTSNSTYRRLWILAYGLLVLIPGLSYGIGADTPSYMAFYNEIKPLEGASLKYLANMHDDILWAVFCSACKSISSEYAFMHTLQCLILHLSVFYFIRKFTAKRFVALLLYYVVLWPHLTFEALRESLALTFYLFALSKLIEKKNYIQYFLIALPGLFFHRFSFIVILLTPLAWMNRQIKIFIPLLLLISTFIVLNIQWFIDAFAQEIMSDNARIALYIEGNIEGDHRMSIIGISSYFIRLVLPPLFIIYLYKKNECLVVNDGLVMLLALASLLGSIASVMTDFRRIYYYFIVLEGVMFGNILAHRKYYKKTFSIRNSLRGLCLLICLTEVLACVGFYQPSFLEYRKGINYDVFYFPYHSVLTKEKNPTREALHLLAY